MILGDKKGKFRMFQAGVKEYRKKMVAMVKRRKASSEWAAGADICMSGSRGGGEGEGGSGGGGRRVIGSHINGDKSGGYSWHSNLFSNSFQW